MSDAHVSLAELLVHHGMCVACLATEANVTASTLDISLALLDRTLHRKSRTCPKCGVPGTVYSLKETAVGPHEV